MPGKVAQVVWNLKSKHVQTFRIENMILECIQTNADAS